MRMSEFALNGRDRALCLAALTIAFFGGTGGLFVFMHGQHVLVPYLLLGMAYLLAAMVVGIGRWRRRDEMMREGQTWSFYWGTFAAMPALLVIMGSALTGYLPLAAWLNAFAAQDRIMAAFIIGQASVLVLLMAGYAVFYQVWRARRG